jgi:hypothetical protein
VPPNETRRLNRLNAMPEEPVASSHPIPAGELVTVIRVQPASAISIEGRAVIKGPARTPNSYHVQFLGDPVVRERIVHPDYQSDPERFLQILRDLWRANDAPDIDDFFPHPTE